MNTTHRTARIAVVLLAALVSCAIAAAFASAAAASGPGKPRTRAAGMHWYRWHPTAHTLHRHFGSKVVIGLRSMQDLRSLRVEYGFGVGRAREIATLHAALVEVDDAQLDALLTRAPRDPRVRYVSPVHRKRNTLTLPNDPYLSRVDEMTNLPYEWAFLSTHVDRALEYTAGDPHVVVGVIDTGVAVVPDLAGKVDSLWNVDGTTITQVFESNDEFGHGTAVASLIAGNSDDGIGLAGFGGQTHVIGVRATSDEGVYTDPAVALGLTKLVSLGARIVNMSLGGRVPSDPILVDAIHLAAANNVLVVASAGNDGAYVGWPAADLQPSGGGRSYGLAVGAIDVDGRRATFSDWGKHLSLVAPGTYRGDHVGVLVALPPASRLDHMGFVTWSEAGGAHYGYVPGTSFAAPQVAGVAALIWAARPDLKNYQVADILKQSAHRAATDWTPGMGCGALDAGAALELATSRTASGWAETPNITGVVCTAFGNAPATWPKEKSQTITFRPIPDKHLGDPDFKVKATASSGLRVSFTTYGSCRVKDATVHLLRAGWCTITASQAGNANYKPARGVARLFFITKGRSKPHHV
jgi:subtilisin family serine protease